MAIRTRGLTKRYGSFLALDGVDLDVPRGSLTALLGPSGSGKSTLLRLIAGLEQPDSGRIWILGDDAGTMSPQERGVGFVFQHYAAFKHMSVRDNVAFGLTVRRRGKSFIRGRVDELLSLVQLEGFADRYPSQLSGGQRQRMALARALAVEPQMLLLDEPFGALDANVRKDLRTWLRRLHDDVHVTTIFVTHDQEEAMEVADFIAVMNRGRIEQVGSPREVYESPVSEFVMKFIGPVNQVGDTFIRPHDIDIRTEATADSVEAMIDRITHIGFEVRVHLSLADGRALWAQVTRDEAEQLELGREQIVHVRPSRTRAFPPALEAAG